MIIIEKILYEYKIEKYSNIILMKKSGIIIHIFIQFLSDCLVLFFKKEKYQQLLQKYCHFWVI